MSVYQLVYNNLSKMKTVGHPYTKEGELREDHKTLPVVDEFQCLKEALENSEHTFIFIITKKQWPSWKDQCKQYGYDEYTLFEIPYFVMNRNYQPPEYTEANGLGGRKLRLVILKGKGSEK